MGEVGKGTSSRKPAKPICSGTVGDIPPVVLVPPTCTGTGSILSWEEDHAIVVPKKVGPGRAVQRPAPAWQNDERKKTSDEMPSSGRRGSSLSTTPQDAACDEDDHVSHSGIKDDSPNAISGGSAVGDGTSERPADARAVVGGGRGDERHCMPGQGILEDWLEDDDHVPMGEGNYAPDEEDSGEKDLEFGPRRIVSRRTTTSQAANAARQQLSARQKCQRKLAAMGPRGGVAKKIPSAPPEELTGGLRGWVTLICPPSPIVIMALFVASGALLAAGFILAGP
jgi:hypothetical protein